MSWPSSGNIPGRCPVLLITLMIFPCVGVPEMASPARGQTAGKSKATRKGANDLSKLEPRLASRLTGHKQAAWSVAFSPSQNLLVSTGDDAAVIFWDPKTGREMSRYDLGSFAHGSDFDRTGRVLAVASMTKYGPGFCGMLKIHDLSNGESVEILSKAAFSFSCVAVHPGGQLVAAGGADRALRVWDLSNSRVEIVNKKPSRSFFEFVSPPALPGPINAVAFHPTKPTVAVGGKGGYVRIFEVRQDRLVPLDAKFDPLAEDILCLQFDKSGNRLLSGDLAGSLRFWNYSARTEPRVVKTSEGAIHRIALDPSGSSLMATAHKSGAIKLWNGEKEEPISASLAAHAGPAYGVDFTADGRNLATSGSDFLVTLWHLYPDEPGPEAKKRR